MVWRGEGVRKQMKLSRNPSPGSQMSPLPQWPNHRTWGSQSHRGPNLGGSYSPPPKPLHPPEGKPKSAGKKRGACLHAEKAKKRSLGLITALLECGILCLWEVARGRYSQLPPTVVNTKRTDPQHPSTAWQSCHQTMWNVCFLQFWWKEWMFCVDL